MYGFHYVLYTGDQSKSTKLSNEPLSTFSEQDMKFRLRLTSEQILCQALKVCLVYRWNI